MTTEARPIQTDLFTSGTLGYHTFRIPALVVTTRGTLLAIAEGRRNSQHDTGDIDLVLRRSRPPEFSNCVLCDATPEQMPGLAATLGHVVLT